MVSLYHDDQCKDDFMQNRYNNNIIYVTVI